MKKTITQEKAGQLLLSYVENPDFADRFYEFAQELCNREIDKIENEYDIVGEDGTPYTDEDDVMWYDDFREDFLKAVFEKIQSGEL